MRITKKIISLLLVVSMVASFFAMTGFEASANLQNQQKTDFGIHFDDTTRKLKVLQLPDIQSKLEDRGNGIKQLTKDTIRLLMERYDPDVILLTGDQTEGGSTASSDRWEDTLDAVFQTFTQYMKPGCQIIAMPGNHEYDYGNMSSQYNYYTQDKNCVDWDNNFSTIDLGGAPGAGNVTVSASSTNKAVALNFAIFNSQGDGNDGELRPGGDNETDYQNIVSWYTNMNNTLASNQYSYKAQVTGAPSALVPTFAAQHVILQEIFSTGAIIAGDITNGVPMSKQPQYSHLTDHEYIRLDPANNPNGTLKEVPCPSTLGAGATRALYDALHNPGNCLGMTFGHDHDNYFDVVDDNGFHFYMGGALTLENYNTDQNPKGRYFEFTLNDETGEVSMTSEVKSYTQLTTVSLTDVSSDRIEALNGENVQFSHTLSTPKIVYVGSAANTNPAISQEFGNIVQAQLLDYKRKQPYDQNLEVKYCLPEGATNITFTAARSSGTAVTMGAETTETTKEGILYKRSITHGQAINSGETINFTVSYKYNGKDYEIHNASYVESIKMPAGFSTYDRIYRGNNKENTDNSTTLAYVSTLSGAGAYGIARATGEAPQFRYYFNTYFRYGAAYSDPDENGVAFANHSGEAEFSMMQWSPDATRATNGYVSQRPIIDGAAPRTDIYLDASGLKPVSATDPRLDTGVSIDFWVSKDTIRSIPQVVAGIGFYEGDLGFSPANQILGDKNIPYWEPEAGSPVANRYCTTYTEAVESENHSLITTGSSDQARNDTYMYRAFANQQSLWGLGTTHVNSIGEENTIGATKGQYIGYPLVVDSKQAALGLNGEKMTMFTGVRSGGQTQDGARLLLYDVAPYAIYFHTFDKGALRELVMGELMNPRVKDDYPNAEKGKWDAYVGAYKMALECYAQTKSDQTTIDGRYSTLQAAIAALLNSNKGEASNEGMLQGTFSSISVPPIIYVNGTTIQTAAPYTDRIVEFNVPEDARDVSCTVVYKDNDNINSAVTFNKLSSSSGTNFKYEVAGGTAENDGAIYYKFTYSLDVDKNNANDDKNEDGKADVYTQYAASYVKSVPNTIGTWVLRTRRNGNEKGDDEAQQNTRIHLNAELALAGSSIFSYSGVSAIVALYGSDTSGAKIQGKSFDKTVIDGTALDNYNHPQGNNDIGWAVGANYSGGNGNVSGYTTVGAGRVSFLADRPIALVGWAGCDDETAPLVSFSGLFPHINTLNPDDNISDEYIVAHVYYDPQATGAAKAQPRFDLSIGSSYNSDNEGMGDSPDVKRYWDTQDYSVKKYGGWYGQTDVSASGIFSTDTTQTNDWPDIISSEVNQAFEESTSKRYKTSVKTTNVLEKYEDKATYARMIIQAEKFAGGANNYSAMGFAFAFNRVDKSKAHQAIDRIIGKNDTSALFNEADVLPGWWAQWRAEVFEVYKNCGNLWTGDYDIDRLETLIETAQYNEANYSKLINTLKEITGDTSLAVNSQEHISDYNILTFAIASGDDQRYAGQRYAKNMFVNNAADLIATIRNRTSVYSERDYNNKPTSEVTGNLHDAHLDKRYQKYIDDYADTLLASWNRLRLAPADYTTFNKYKNYYNSTDDTILFLRDEYAGYNNDGIAKNYANEKVLASGVFTYTTYTAFKNALNIDTTLKKPSEDAVIGTLPRIYPQSYTYKNVTSPAVADTTNCLYNTARDAYEALKFRQAGEYYSANGAYTENGVTYYANYNKTDRGSSYSYTPVFSTSYKELSADIVKAGYVVTDNKVKETYNKGNSGDTNGNGKYDEGEIWVTNGAGEYTKAINPWTDASWGGSSYGFTNAYEEYLKNASSTYQSTNSESTWILALFAEDQILPGIAAVDYFYDKLVPASYDMSELQIQQREPAQYEKGTTAYEELAGYVIYDANGNVLTDGAQWYTADTWADYLTTKNAQPGVIDNATLAENQDAINALTQAIYQKRAALQLRPMDEFRVGEANAILGKTTFSEINDAAAFYVNDIANKVVKVFKSYYPAPQTLEQVQGNALNFTDHPYYTNSYKDAMSGAYSAIQGYSGKPMASNIANYKAAIDSYVALYNQKDNAENLNGADYSGLTMLLNKIWIPKYEQYGAENGPDKSWPLGGMNTTGADWYTAESWQAYYNAREAAMKFFVGQNSYNPQSGYMQAYGDAGANGIATNGLKVDNQGDGAIDVEGSINKATYDLLVAYYKLAYKKVSDFDGDVGALTGGYDSINAQLDALIGNKANETVDVVIVNAEGQLETVQRTLYDPDAIEEARSLAAEISALANENLGEKYKDYVNAVNNYKSVIDKLKIAPAYLEGWDAIIDHLNDNAGDTITISDSGTMANYFNTIYGEEFDATKSYSDSNWPIQDIFSDKTGYDRRGYDAWEQDRYNALVTAFYDELNAAAFVPKQLSKAISDAETKLAEGTKAAYDPLQLNGRDKVATVSRFTSDSVAQASALVDSNRNTKVTLWDTAPNVTGYQTSAVTVDGSLADEIWAAVGLTNASGTKDYDGKDRDDRYLLVEGGQFLEALEDAIEYANGELYDENGEIKTFEIVKGNGEIVEPKPTLFTDESVQELVDALARAVVTDETTQDQIDQMVFDILEQTDIDNTIFLLAEDGTFYGTLNNIAEDNGLKYKPAEYKYFEEELAKALEAKSDGAQELIYQVWLDNGDGTFTLINELGSRYFTADTWDPYREAYNDALKADRALTAKYQAIINEHTTEIFATREILTWKGIDDSTQNLIDSIYAQIDSLSTTLVTVNTYQNSVIRVLDDGKRELTAPSIGSIQISPYGDISEITGLWEEFSATYLQGDELDVTMQQQMLDSLAGIQELLAQLETKKFGVEDDNEFTIGVRNLVDNFIAGTYTYNGIGSSNGVGTYTADYLTTEATTNISAAEQNVRNAQRIAIQDKLNAIYTVLGSNYEVGDPYTDHSTGVGVQYTTALDAVNALTMDLYGYVTGQYVTYETANDVVEKDYSLVRAQYAGFALDMRQNMYDFLSTEITVLVETRQAASQTLYKKVVPLFAQGIEPAKSAIDGNGIDDFGAFGAIENWPTINQLDESVGITQFDESTGKIMISETVHHDQLIFQTLDENGDYVELLVGKEIVALVGGYSYLYSDSLSALNPHYIKALEWITNSAVYDTGSEIYFLASPAGEVDIEGSVFAYTMNAVPANTDGDWYTNGYGIVDSKTGSVYYLAYGKDTNSVTGSSYGGWFTNATYESVINQRTETKKLITDLTITDPGVEEKTKPYGTGPNASAAMGRIQKEATDLGVCWNSANREAIIKAIEDDQETIDKATVVMYERLCKLELLEATDAYREVAGLIYDALGLVPTYSSGNVSDIIIVDGNGATLEANPLGGRVFNISLLTDLDDLSTPEVDYKKVTDADGNVSYYSTKLPSNYDGGKEAVEYILNTVFSNEITNKYTIDKAALVNGDTNSVKSRIIAELEKLGLGLADLSKITSLTQAFLYNNPSNSASLGSYDIDDNGVGEQFFGTTHPTLGEAGTNAGAYRDDSTMKGAGSAYHASGFYDFTKYTDESLRDVINFLANNDIINAIVEADANNFDITNKTGFNIEFNPTVNGDTLYKTSKTQQTMIDNTYKELVNLINALELRKATTTTLEEAIGSGDTIMVNETLYDHGALDADGKNIWEEFAQALENANEYVGVTVINEVQVLEAEDRLEKAIKALVLYVDTFAPVVTIHNTQSDLNKFYAAHADELKNTIASADKMVTASYMTPNLGGYTLYVYTNQLNPQIVVSLKDTTSALNTDGSQRTVTTSKPEKMSVSAQAMDGVTANVIAPVHDAATGTALSSELVTLTGATTVSTQTAKNANGGYDADSSAYLILSPQFTDKDGTQQAAAYTISASDSAIKKDAETGEITSTANGATSFDYASGDEVIETTEEGKITVFVYYMNSMPDDGSDNGVNADGTVNDSAVLTSHEYYNIAKDKWINDFSLFRIFNSAVRNWEFSDSPATLPEGATYVDPTFGENNFGSFVYKLDPDATSGLDYDVAKAYFEEGEAAAKEVFISALNSNNDFIAAFDAESKNADSTKFKSYGANDNWVAVMGAPNNGELMFVHVADRFGNVCNRIVQVSHYDQLKPVLTADGAGAATVTEPGGSGVAKVDLFNYMGTQGSSLYIDYLFKMLHVDDFTYVSSDNSFTISTGAENAGKLFTVAVTDHAGNVGSVPVNADANGDIVLTVVETYDNVVKYKAAPEKVDVNTGEDVEVIEFVFNSNETIILNFIEPSSIVKAGPDGNVFANKKNVPLNIIVKSGVEAIKLYNVDSGTEEIWTADNATITDNGDGTSTWTVKYTFTEGTHNYSATAKVDGKWETIPVDFSFVATTKSIEVKLIVAGIGKIRFGYNDGNYSNVPVMSKKTVPYGSVVTLEAVQTEVGSDFYFWTNNGSNRIISASTVYEFTAVTNMDLTSQFTTNECFDNNKKLVVYVNNAENVVENFELAEDEDYTVPSAPSLPEHVFKNWSMTKEEILASDEMMIIVRPVYSLVVKNTVTLTEGNWTTTGAGVYESVDNDRALVSISASATNDAGEDFLYWLDAETGDIASYNRSYTFHAIKDTELTPVYGDASAVVPVPVARISTAKYDSAAKKVNFYAERSVPAGYDLIQTGIIVTKTASVGNDEDAFILDASGVGKGPSKSTAANGYYAGAVSATAGTVVYARAYIIYQNADGDIITAYSPIASYNA